MMTAAPSPRSVVANALLLALTLLAASLPCQMRDRPDRDFAGARTVLRPRPGIERALDARCYWQDRLILKFSDTRRVRLADRQDRDDMLAASRAATREALRGLRIEPVFSRPSAELEAERRAILAASPHLDLADLANYYRVFTSGRAATRRLLEILLDDPTVETAYPEFHPGAGVPAQGQSARTVAVLAPGGGTSRTAPIRTPSFEDQQHWLGRAPSGLGMLPAQDCVGAQGHAAQTIVQIEGAWSFGHEDLPQLTAASVLGSRDFGSWNARVWRDHGTAAVGILHSARNRFGTRGIVPESKLLVASVARGHGDAVSRATRVARAGDVFTSSLVFAVYLGNRGFHAPFDLPQDVYDAIRIAVAKGIVVTVAAGNTGNDLGNTQLYGFRYDSNATPSGAWICGATLRDRRKAVSWSNYGDAVRFSAWGSDVATTAYGHLFHDPARPEQRDYTNVFGGTSAASPQIAGAAAAVQSVAWQTYRKTLGVEELAKALERHATPIDGRVGPRPDIDGTLRGLGLVDGLRLATEAYPGDTLRFRLALGNSESFVLLGATRQTSIPVPGFRFPILVDPSSVVTLDVGTNLRSGPFDFRLKLPPNESLGGLELFYQAVRLNSKTMGIDLTNAVRAWLREPR